MCRRRNAAAGRANGSDSVNERARAAAQRKEVLVTAQLLGGWGGPAKPEGGDQRSDWVGPPEIREKERDEAEECRDFGEGPVAGRIGLDSSRPVERRPCSLEVARFVAR